ncbi:MAG TPA: peptidoglycan DD-metalloendopeptidase family protein [Syntrophorhabdaceae bacterium]|nr:peptidoglycan DD-metalloendopeptidase family protein [Syntrophorhabdaceae bacterium]
MNTGKIARLLLVLIAIACIIAFIGQNRRAGGPGTKRGDGMLRKITGTIKKGDTLSQLFKHNKLNIADLKRARDVTDGIYDLGELCSDHPYSITIDREHRLTSLTYSVDDDTYLEVSREGSSFTATLGTVEYDRRIISFGGTIKENLIESLGAGRDALLLALDLSDIFAWDIDFTTDLREGDTYRIVVEGLYMGNTFRKFGSILSAEFVNNGESYTAYRFGTGASAEYYDAAGTPLKKAFLKAPLNFRRISSLYTKKRYHPILKRYRPHMGIDYAAAAGTPVSALGDGTISYAGYRGGYGKLVIIRHRNGYSTYYGHLSRIQRDIRRSARVAQGDIVGFVGTTGLATGPHLHFEMRVAGKPVNPFSVKPVNKEPLRAGEMPRFKEFVRSMDLRLELAAISKGPPLPAMTASGTQPKGG